MQIKIKEKAQAYGQSDTDYLGILVIAEVFENQTKRISDYLLDIPFDSSDDFIKEKIQELFF